MDYHHYGADADFDGFKKVFSVDEYTESVLYNASLFLWMFYVVLVLVLLVLLLVLLLFVLFVVVLLSLLLLLLLLLLPLLSSRSLSKPETDAFSA